LLSDYVNPIVYDFWTKMQKATLIDLAKKCVPLNVTGDGQEICTFVPISLINITFFTVGMYRVLYMYFVL
jgi:hypothetical protein